MSAFTRFTARVQDARHTAEVQARAEAREVGSAFVRSRGTFLCTANDRGDQCAPAPEAEAQEWDGTKAEIEHLVDDVQVRHPEVVEIYVAGGFDSAERLTDFNNGDYEPWVSSWHVTVWRRRADGKNVWDTEEVTL